MLGVELHVLLVRHDQAVYEDAEAVRACVRSRMENKESGAWSAQTPVEKVVERSRNNAVFAHRLGKVARRTVQVPGFFSASDDTVFTGVATAVTTAIRDVQDSVQGIRTTDNNDGEDRFFSCAQYRVVAELSGAGWIGHITLGHCGHCEHRAPHQIPLDKLEQDRARLHDRTATGTLVTLKSAKDKKNTVRFVSVNRVSSEALGLPCPGTHVPVDPGVFKPAQICDAARQYETSRASIALDGVPLAVVREEPTEVRLLYVMGM